MSETIKKSSFIFSEVVTEPSPIDLLDASRSDSQKFNPKTWQSMALNNQLPKEANDILSQKGLGSDSDWMSRKLRDFFDSVKCGPESQEETIWVPTWEIHRPKIDKCTATLKQTSTSQADLSLNITVFGIGGGVSKSTKIGTATTIKAAGQCLQIGLPVTITNQECTPKKGKPFTRTNIKDIGTDIKTIELTDPKDDKCGLTSSQIKAKGWKPCSFDIAPNTTATPELDIQASQSATLSAQVTIGSIEIGPKAVLTLAREIGYSYELVGPHNYIAYSPENSIAYCWSCT